MANMSYCRFENTLNDLAECHEAMTNEEEKLSISEQRAKECLIKLCRKIADEFEDE